MSRCKACDVIMNDFEMRRIDRATGDYSELCSQTACQHPMRQR